MKDLGSLLNSVALQPALPLDEAAAVAAQLGELSGLEV